MMSTFSAKGMLVEQQQFQQKSTPKPQQKIYEYPIDPIFDTKQQKQPTQSPSLF